MANITAAERIEEIEAEYGVEVEVTGGGKGWTAKATYEGTDLMSVKLDSKMGVLSLLDNSLQEWANTDEADALAGEEIEGCSDECQSSTSNICQCACGGDNHGIGVVIANRKPTVVVGEKPCKCGCGQTTKRTFVPGHDARYHGLVALREWAKAEGLTGTDEDLRKAKAASLRKAARVRRAAARAEIGAKAAKIAASIK